MGPMVNHEKCLGKKNDNIRGKKEEDIRLKHYIIIMYLAHFSEEEINLHIIFLQRERKTYTICYKEASLLKILQFIHGFFS